MTNFNVGDIEIDELKRRVSELETKVAELESGESYSAESITLETSPIPNDLFVELFPEKDEEEKVWFYTIDASTFDVIKTANELRKQAIEEAKEFVSKTTFNARYGCESEGNFTYRYIVAEPEFIVNEEKRTVVALVREVLSGKIREKGIAKCAPSDVFNADIGKAIALGSAYGLDVSKFENAPQPTEPAVGMYVEYRGNFFDDKDYVKDNDYQINTVSGLSKKPERLIRIISDTGVQY